jgi:hypothetical protein
MLERKEIIQRAFDDCMREMYAKSQPEADYDNLIQEYKDGKIGKEERIYDRHYLSQEEFLYIRNKYKEAYNIKSHWKDDIEILEDYLNKGGLKDKYIPEKKDPDGFVHPGYRSSEKVQPLKDQIDEVITKFYGGKKPDQERLVDNLMETIMGNISNCKDFYKFDAEESSFDCSIALGASPSGSAKNVKEWWKDNYNVDIEMEERNPLLFWEQDYYGDEFEEVMEEEDGPDWKEKWDKKWKDQVAKKKAEHEKKLEELRKQIEQEENEKK